MHKNNNEQGYPDPGYAWYVVVILFLAYTIAYIDRQCINLLVEPIKRDLQISDTGISLLQGFAFVFFYTVFGIPLGRLADRKNRRIIIAIGIFFWSLMTAVCGLARSFWALFAARVGVGIGEACLSPAAYSLIADLFPKNKRGVPISFYAMGIYFGSGLAAIVVGYIIDLVSRSDTLVVPLLGALRPWQATFFIVGVPGLILVALVALTVQEPARRELLDNDGIKSGGHLSIAETTGYFLERWRVYGCLFFGYALKATLSYGFLAWIPSMFIRTFGWSAGEIGKTFGMIVAVFGTLGILAGGFLAHRLVVRDRHDSYLRISIIGAAVAMLLSVPAVLVSDPRLALALLSPAMACLGASIGLAPAAVSFITPNQLRGQAISLYIFVVALVGMNCGPTSIALITDYVFRDPDSLRYSLAIFTLTFGTMACTVLRLGIRPYLHSVSEMSARTSSK
jgi:MFS family permease